MWKKLLVIGLILLFATPALAADVKITALPAASAIAGGTDLFLMVDMSGAGVTKKISVTDMFGAIPVPIVTTASDGSNYIKQTNNASTEPTVTSSYMLYVYDGKWKIAVNGTKYFLAYKSAASSSAGQLVKYTGEGGQEQSASTVTEDGTEMNLQALNMVTTGVVLGGIKVVTKSADYTIGTDDSHEAYGGFFFNTAASTRTFTLPSAVAGMSVCIKNAQGVAQILRLDANTDDYIVKSTGARTSAAAEYYGSTADASAMLCVVAYDSTDWHVTAERGTWTEE